MYVNGIARIVFAGMCVAAGACGRAKVTGDASQTIRDAPATTGDGTLVADDVSVTVGGADTAPDNISDGGAVACGTGPLHTWRAVDSQTAHGLTSIHGSGPQDVWAVGSEIVHWDGTRWTLVEPFQLEQAFFSVWVAAPNEPVVGLRGAIQRRMNGTWVRTPLAEQDALVPIGALWGGEGELWAAEAFGNAKAYHYDGRGVWSEFYIPLTSGVDFWGSSPGDVWLVGGFWEGGHRDWVRHFSNGAVSNDLVSPFKNDNDSYGGMDGIWGSGPLDIWLLRKNRPRRFNGSTWRDVDGIAAIDKTRAIWGSGPADVIVVGDRGRAWRWDGNAWCFDALPTSDTLWAIWGSGPADVWAVGDNGTILHVGAL
jgi:hypothetical protein